jgi:5-methylcytosine-specific restriction protein A
MALKPCLDCGERTKGSRCAACAAGHANARPWAERRKIRSGWAWSELREQVRARDRVCVRCGGTDGLEVHHRIPLADGGSNRLDNLELVCLPCHGRAHGRKSIRRQDARRRDESGAATSTPMIT